MRVLAIFYLTTPVGSALGYVVGSSVSALFNCWQWAFRVTPILGVILAFLCCCCVQEPPRGHSDVNSESGLTASGQTLKGASGVKVFIRDVIAIIKW
jgi:MFS family permease